MRKILPSKAAAVILASAAFFLSISCGKKEDKNLVRFSGFMSPGEFLLVPKVLEKFKGLHPDVNVKYEVISGNYLDIMQTRIAGGTPPCVFYLEDLYAPDFMSRGVLVPLDDFIKRDGVDTRDFYPNLLKAFQYEGKTYGLPKDYNTLGLFFNTEMFSEKSLSPPKNWDELYETAKKLTGPRNGKKVHGLCLSADLARWLVFLYQAGGSLISRDGKKMAVNSKAGLKALEFYSRLIKEKVAIEPGKIGTTWCGQAFGLGKAAMAIEGGWLIPSLANDHPDLKYSIAELPMESERATIAFTVAYGIPKRCKNREGAWALIKYLTSPRGMKAWTELGLALPSRKSVTDKSDYYIANPQWKALIDGTEYARPWQFTSKFGRVTMRTSTDIEAVFLNLMTPEDALKDIQEYGDNLLERYTLTKGGSP